MTRSAVTAALGGAAMMAALFGAVPAAAASSDLVAVVIDFGPGGPAQIVACVHDAGQTDAQAISDALAQVGAANSLVPNSSGLIVSVDGYPSSVNTQPDAKGHYAYWAFFLGTSSGWTYANEGPGFLSASSTTTVGFRFEPTGSGSPSDPPPSAPADPLASCPAIAAGPPTTPAPAPITTIPVGSVTTSTTAPVAAAHTTTTVAPTTIGHATLRALKVSEAAPAASSPVGTVVALALFALLGLGAGGVVWRRRRAP